MGEMTSKNLFGPMVHVASAIRPNGLAEFIAWIKARGWDAVYFKLMNRQHDGDAAGKDHTRSADYKYFRRIAPLMRAEGIEPCIWAYVSPLDARDQGANFGRLCENCGVKVAIVNAEKEFKQALPAIAKQAAIDWLAGFRETAPANVRLGLSTFAQPSLHRRFPFAEFMLGCDFFSPQCYGSYPSKQVKESFEYAKSMGKECWPAFRAFIGSKALGDWVGDAEFVLRTTAAAIATARGLGIRSWMFWQQKALQSWPEMLKIIEGAGASEAPEGPANAMGLTYAPGVVVEAVRGVQVDLNRLGRTIGGRLAYLVEEPLDKDGRLGALTAKPIFLASGRWPYRTPEKVRREVEADLSLGK